MTNRRRRWLLATLALCSISLGCSIKLGRPIVGASADVATYVVQPDDTLSSIALAYGTTVQAFIAANNLQDADLIYAGEILVVPDGGTATGTAVATVPMQNIYVVQWGDT